MKNIKNYDFTLIITPILLTGFGIIMIYSASMVIAVMDGYESTHFLYRQLIWFILGLVGFVFFSIFPYKAFQRLIKLIILLVIGLLIGVLLVGDEVNNAQSWLTIGPVRLQPSEFAKLGLIIYLASVYSKKQAYINDFARGVLPPLIITGIVFSLVVMQPDIGTAAIIFLIACSIIFSSGIKFKHLTLLVVISLLLLAITIPNMVTDERLARFTGAYQPFESHSDDGYHLIQSYLAIGVGGLTGEGLGQSIQKLGFLYAPYNDFIMAVIAEELGFIGVLIVIGMLLIIVFRGLFISWKCTDSFGALLAIGISSMVGIQSFINLGAISGLLPVTGVTLPFISYGGSSLLVLMAAMGILNNIAMHVKKKDRLRKQLDDNKRVPNRFQHKGEKTWTS